jgi:hypothetical protein
MKAVVLHEHGDPEKLKFEGNVLDPQIGFLFIVAPECQAQSSAQATSSMTAPHKLEFEVASLRQDKLGGQATSNFPPDRGNWI